MNDACARADAWRRRREAAVAAAANIVVEFRDQLHGAFANAPLLETVWTDRLTGRIADLLLQRKLYAYRAEQGAAPPFFVVADSAAAADAAVASAMQARETDESRAGGRSASGIGAPSWPDGYRRTVVEAGDVVTLDGD